jgi:hypothetical protein
VVTTFVGGINATNGAFADGIGTQAGFFQPWGLTFDVSGNLMVADVDNRRIRMVTPAGVVTTIAGGVMGTNMFFADATGSLAGFQGPSSVAIDSIGNVIVTDSASNRIRRVTPVGVVTTIAGSGAYSYTDGVGTIAGFRNLRDASVDVKSGNIIVADSFNHIIRILTPPAGTTIITVITTLLFSVFVLSCVNLIINKVVLFSRC